MRVPRDLCLVVNYKQKTGEVIDLTRTFSFETQWNFLLFD